jgi:hypothetical protein
LLMLEQSHARFGFSVKLAGDVVILATLLGP